MKDASNQYQRESVDLSHLIYTNGRLGRIKPIALYEVNAGDSFSINIDGAIRMAPLRAPLMMDPHIHIAAYFVQHRKMYNYTTPQQWEDFIMAGTAGGVTLDVLTPTVNKLDFIPNTPVASGTNSFAAHLIRGINSIWNDYYRIPNITDEVDLDSTTHDFWDIDTLKARWGLIAARLPEFWTTGLTDSRYNAQDFADLSTAAADISLLDIAQVQGEYQTEVQRDWFDRRYRDLIKNGWGTNGIISTDADARPEILTIEQGFLNGSEIDVTADAGAKAVGEYVGKSTGPFSVHIPPKYFKEHGMIWIVACIRYPAILQEQEHYLRNRTLDYENFAADPKIVSTRGPVELTKQDFITNASTNKSWGHHPFGQQWRTQPHVVDKTLWNVNGYPFVDEDAINGGTVALEDVLRYYNEYNFGGIDDFFGSTTLFGNGHYMIAANAEVTAKRTLPSATTSIYAGAHLN